MIHTTSSPQQTREYATMLIKQYPRIALIGEVGSGKTHFVQGAAIGLGIDVDVVQSPTYAYLNIYDDKLLHIDMDRLQTEQQLFESGIIEAIERYPYVLIEWPKYTELYASDFIFLDIKKVSVTQRIFTLYGSLDAQKKSSSQ